MPLRRIAFVFVLAAACLLFAAELVDGADRGARDVDVLARVASWAFVASEIALIAVVIAAVRRRDRRLH